MNGAGAHDDLAGDMVAFKGLLALLGARYRARESQHWWPAKVIPWMGCVADTNGSAVRIEDKKTTKGMALRQEIFGL